MKPWAIFTDLDGTLLDADSFSYEPALSMLVRLRGAGVPVIPITSKTRAEVVSLAAELDLPGPIVVESGGGILRQSHGRWVLETLGVESAQLRKAAHEIGRRAQCRLELLSGMGHAEACRASGLSGEALARALEREFDEPFLAPAGSVGLVRKAAEDLGLSVRRGGRFLHLCGRAGKGGAVSKLRTELASTLGTEPIVVGLGDSPLDAEFLVQSDIPIIVPRPDGTPDPELVRDLPRATVAPAPGPRGWAEAVGSAWARLRDASIENDRSGIPGHP